jgi:hypothetical protein
LHPFLRRATPCAWLAVAFLTIFTASAAAAAPFGWFHAAAPPPGWKLLTLPVQHATVAVPPSMTPLPADPGAVSAAKRTHGGLYLEYLNLTPIQGAEQLPTWPAFRLDRLAEEGQQAVNETAQATALTFRGGTGSCVIDDYVTREKNHHYRELACFVRGRHGAAVVIVAALVSKWASAHAELERAVETFSVG